MTAPRPPLRLVGGRDRARPADDDADFEPVERAPHDLHLHQPYRELAAVEADEDDDLDDAEPPRTPLSPRFVIVALVALQLLGALSYLPKYLALARSGAEEFVFAAVLSVPAMLCLLAGAALLALRPGRGRMLFVVAAVGLGLAVAGWGVSYVWSWPVALGAMLGLAGAWYARAEVPRGDDSGARP
jgi:hypothetical protein